MNQTSRIGVAISTAESIGLIVIGVLASQLDQWWAVFLLVVIACVIGYGRYLTAIPAHAQENREWLKSYLEDSTDLEEVLRGLASSIDKDVWHRRDVIEAIGWWIQNDLFDVYLGEREAHERRRAKSQTSGLSRLSKAIRHPVLMIRGKLRQLERSVAASSERNLLLVVAQLPERDVARIITAAGEAAGFLEATVAETNRGHQQLGHRLVLPTQIAQGVD